MITVMYQSLFISSSNHDVNSFELISINKLAFLALALALGIFPKSHLTWVAHAGQEETAHWSHCARYISHIINF